MACRCATWSSRTLCVLGCSFLLAMDSTVARDSKVRDTIYIFVTVTVGGRRFARARKIRTLRGVHCICVQRVKRGWDTGTFVVSFAI
jgi:hypothetical protein